MLFTTRQRGQMNCRLICKARLRERRWQRAVSICWQWMLGDAIFIPKYTPRHSFWKKEPTFTQQYPAEVKRLTKYLSKLVIGVLKATDNHFSGNPDMNYFGEMGGKGIWTTARGRIPKKYLQCKKDFWR